MHVKIHSRVVPWKVDVIFCKDFLFNGDWVEDEAEVWMTLEVADVPHEKSPGYLSGEFVKRKVDLL